MKSRNIHKIFNAISLVLLVIFIMAIISNYIAEYLKEINWFGDYVDNKGYDKWGTRHYIYNFFVFFLSAFTLLRGVLLIGNLFDRIIEEEKLERFKN